MKKLKRKEIKEKLLEYHRKIAILAETTEGKAALLKAEKEGWERLVREKDDAENR